MLVICLNRQTGDPGERVMGQTMKPQKKKVHIKYVSVLSNSRDLSEKLHCTLVWTNA